MAMTTERNVPDISKESLSGDMGLHLIQYQPFQDKQHKIINTSIINRMNNNLLLLFKQSHQTT